uniref:MICOS complex subunit n=1 Tax=Sus scrofa TaxID=9823 RepID=A0A8D0MHQ1_PIG
VTAFRMGERTTMAAGLIVASVKGHAAKEEDAKKQLMKPEQLPITTKPPLRSRYAEEQPGCLPRALIHSTATGRYFGWCKGVSVFVKNRSTGAVQFGKGGCVYAKNLPGNVLPKMGGISASALVGFVSARRGSRFRKIASATPRPGTGHLRSNGLLPCCCPVQLVITAKVTGKKAYATSQQIYEAVKSLWTKQQQQRVISDPKEKMKLGMPLPTELSSATKTKTESIAGATMQIRTALEAERVQKLKLSV